MTILHQKIGFSLPDITYNKGDTFRVYLRKSNGRKKLTLITKDAALAASHYVSYKVFLNDTKYIEATGLDGKTKTLVKTRGIGPQPNYTSKGRPPRPNFKTLHINRIEHLPETLVDKLNNDLPDRRTKTEVLGILLSFLFVQDDAEEFFRENEKHYLKHKYDSGLINSEEIAKVLIDGELL